jgi:thioredoxin reductase
MACPPSSGSSFDLIIIGGGTIGLSAAYHAVMRGLNTVKASCGAWPRHPTRLRQGFTEDERYLVAYDLVHQL